MDWNTMKDAVSNITLYDVKAGVRKVQNGKAFVSTSCLELFSTIKIETYGLIQRVVCSRHELYGDGGEGNHSSQTPYWIKVVTIEFKVREATNNEPWGASSTTMQEIANGTFN
jgi:epsin